jgi:hypothetical protein
VISAAAPPLLVTADATSILPSCDQFGIGDATRARLIICNVSLYTCRFSAGAETKRDAVGIMYHKSCGARLGEAAISMLAVGVAGYTISGLLGAAIGMIVGLCIEWAVNDLGSFRRSVLNIYSLHVAVILSPTLIFAAH